MKIRKRKQMSWEKEKRVKRKHKERMSKAAYLRATTPGLGKKTKAMRSLKYSDL